MPHGLRTITRCLAELGDFIQVSCSTDTHTQADKSSAICSPEFWPAVHAVIWDSILGAKRFKLSSSSLGLLPNLFLNSPEFNLQRMIGG